MLSNVVVLVLLVLPLLTDFLGSHLFWAILIPSLLVGYISFQYVFLKSILSPELLWRIVKGVSFVYLLLMVSLSALPKSSVISILNCIDPVRLGYPLPEKHYADVCEIYSASHPSGDPWFNVKDRIDFFVFAHLFGWLVKAVILRDWAVLWVTSLLFEWCEVSLRHLLPNFYECWWDHLIADIFGCNLAGMWLGMALIGWLGCERWGFSNWVDRLFVRSSSLKDESVSGHQQRIRSFIGFLLICALVTIIDLNIFFLKALLWIPTDHWLLAMRTALFVLISAEGTAELGRWIQGKQGSLDQFFLGVGILIAELVCIVRFSKSVFHESMPLWVVLVWLVIAAVIAYLWRAVATPKVTEDAPNTAKVLNSESAQTVRSRHRSTSSRRRRRNL